MRGRFAKLSRSLGGDFDASGKPHLQFWPVGSHPISELRATPGPQRGNVAQDHVYEKSCLSQGNKRFVCVSRFHDGVSAIPQ